MMSKFCIATLVATSALANYAFENGTVRMEAEHIRSERGGLADVLADPDFKLDDGNQSYWFMDTSALYREESAAYK